MLEYLPFCDEGSVFYRPGGNPDRSQRLQSQQLPPDWQKSVSGVWEQWRPAEMAMQIQGWKIHVSATPENAVSTLAIVSGVCLEEQVAFKFLPTELELQLSNAKSADRSSSGKFITVYPRPDRSFDALATKLDAALGSRPGPYILSDVRLNNGPVFFRYGGFLPVAIGNHLDETEFAIERDGILVTDQRTPFFSAPERVSTPQVVRDAMRALSDETTTDLDQYTSVDPLHFSNSGGVYLASSGEGAHRTVIKEARPFAGLDLRGRDAVSRLGTEHEMLELLADTGVAPRPIRTFTAWEHHFLEMEYLPYPTLRDWTVQNFPFAEASASALDRHRFAVSASRITSNIIAAARTVHERGRVLGDLHPDNVLVCDDLSIRLLDFEDGRAVDSTEPSGFNALGYKAPARFSPTQADWYSVARVAASMYHVEFLLELLVEDGWEHTLRRIGDEFGEVALEPIRLAIELSEQSASARPTGRPYETVRVHSGFDNLVGDLPALTTALSEGIARARGSVSGQLYPGDIAQWSGSGSLDIASGASGNAFILQRTRTHPQSSADLDWIARGAESSTAQLRPGLFNGLSGIAAALSAGARRDDSSRAIWAALSLAAEQRRSDLFGGLAGVGLAALSAGAAWEAEEVIEGGRRLAEILEQRLFQLDLGWSTRPLDERAGLMFGWSGVSLLFTALANLGIDPAWNAEVSKACIARDLEHTTVSVQGIRAVIDDEAGRTLPYLAWGSAGILTAISALRTVPDYTESFSEEWESLIAACKSRVYAYAGLFNGRAGVIAALRSAEEFQSDLCLAIRDQLELLSEHALEWDETLQFPGEGYLRLSTDYGTGSSGILAAIHSLTAHPFSWMPLAELQTLFPFGAGIQ